MADVVYSRPGTIPDLRSRFESFVTPHGRHFAADLRPDPDDVFIVTPPKCGTTWLQQIVHGLRSGGSMDFGNINDVVPWLGITPVDDPSSAGDQAWRPRAFKSHAPLDRVPTGGRYVVVLRDPGDALVSHYQFFAGAFFDADAIDLDMFAWDFAIPDGEVLDHAVAAWRRRDDDDVLIVFFEDLKSDLPTTVDRVAEFIGVRCAGDLREVVVRQAGLAFMKRHEAQFDDTGLFESFRHRMRLPPTTGLSKVRSGRVGSGASRLSDDVRAALEASWTRRVTPVTGLGSYAELRSALTGT